MTVTSETFSTTQERLFDVLVDPDTYPQWLVGTKKIREVSPDWPKANSFFEHVVGFGPIVIPDRTTVRKVQPNRVLELLVRARPAIKAVVRFEIEAQGDSCLLWMTEEPIGIHALFAPILQPLIRARNERSLQRLHDVVDKALADH